MSDYSVKIDIKAQDGATPVLNGVKQAAEQAEQAINKMNAQQGGGVGGLTTQMSSLSTETATLAGESTAAGSAIGGMGAAMGVVAAGAAVLLVSQLGSMAMELGNLGEQANIASGRFVVFSGDAASAAENLSAIRDAAQGGADDVTLMAEATKLLSMGLASNSQEIHDNVEAAVMLGRQEADVTTRMHEWNMMLANQSIRLADNFGLSIDKLRTRQDELMAGTDGLSKAEAFVASAMEQATEKVNELSAANVEAVTSSDKLAASWQNLKYVVGERLAGPTSALKGAAANVLGDIGQGLALGSSNADVKIAAINAELEDTRQLIEDIQGQGPIGDDWQSQQIYNELLDASNLRLEELKNLLYDTIVAKMQWDAAMDVGAGALNLFSSSANQWWTGGSSSATSMNTLGGISLAPEPSATQFYKWEQEKEANDEIIKERERLEKEANRRIAAQMEAEFSGAVSTIKGHVQTAIEASKGLTPKDATGRGYVSMWEPGGNGPFENLFRAKDVAVHGGASPWASVLGLDQATAASISGNFEKGLFTEDVMGLIDMPAMVEAVKTDQLAKDLLDKFAKSVAESAGVSGNVVMSMMGYDTKEGGTPDNVTDTGKQLAKDITGSLKDESKKATSAGEALMGYLIDGLDNRGKDLNDKARELVEAMLAAMASAVSGYVPPPGSGTGGTSGVGGAQESAVSHGAIP